jgi:hypothetical protein
MAIALSTFEAVLTPLQGLWTWLITPIEGQAPAPTGPLMRVPARAGRAVPRAAAPLRRAARPLRVVRVVEPGPLRSAAGRMVISGRMADVCAELDRLAAQEARAAG